MSTTSRLHDRALELAAAALDFRLPAAELAELERHLAACPACARTTGGLRGDLALLRHPATLLPPRRVDDAVHAAIAGRDPRTSPQRLFVLVAATALLLVALLGVAAAGALLLQRRPPVVVVDPSPSVPAVVVEDASASPGPSGETGAASVAMPVIRDHMSAEEVVEASQEVHRNPRPFTLTTTFGPLNTFRATWYGACGDLAVAMDRAQIHWRYYYDGSSFRQECRYGGEDGLAYVGGLEVQGPDGHGIWGDPTWKIVPTGFLGRPGGVPLATPLWLNWLNVGAVDDPAAGTPTTCLAWELGTVEEVAGRPAQVVACGSERYWIDRASGLLLKRERDGSVLTEAGQLRIGRPDAPGLFTIHDDGASTALVAGATPLSVTLPRAGGGPWSSDSLRGRPAAILIQPECPAPGECLEPEAFVAVVTERSDRLNAAAISVAGGISGISITTSTKAGVPVAMDDQSGWPRWSETGIALFDADGRIVAVVNPRTTAALETAVDALLAGREIPEDPVPLPWAAYFGIGRAVPDLRGLLLVDGRLTTHVFTLAETRGRPVAVLGAPQMFLGEISDACGARTSVAAALTSMLEARRALGDAASLVVVVRDPPTAATAELWDELMTKVAGRDDEIAIVWPYESTGLAWSYLRPSRNDDRCMLGMLAPAMVILDPDGFVRSIFGDALPSATDLEAQLRDLRQ